MPTKEEYFEQGVMAQAEQRYEDAITAYLKALEADPNYSDCLHGLGMAYMYAGQLENAIATAKRLIEIDPNDILAHTSLSMFYQRKGMIAEAEQEGAVAKMLSWKQTIQESKPSAGS